MMTDNEKIQWIIKQHSNTNHLYDGYLPYQFHLKMTAMFAEEFNHLLENEWSNSLIAAWAHDLIEDTRVTYNDVKNILGEYVADIVYAVTNEKGKNRKERANEKYYLGIKETPGAKYIKICDRIANATYSKNMGGSMLELYKNEFVSFENNLRDGNNDPYSSMFDYLHKILH